MWMIVGNSNWLLRVGEVYLVGRARNEYARGCWGKIFVGL